MKLHYNQVKPRNKPQQVVEALNAIYASKAILEKIYPSLRAIYVGIRDET
jgi:hypothetical protein